MRVFWPPLQELIRSMLCVAMSSSGRMVVISSRQLCLFPFSHLLMLLLQVFQEVRKLKAPERLKKRREWQAKARAAKEKQAQSEGTAV